MTQSLSSRELTPVQQRVLMAMDAGNTAVVFVPGRGWTWRTDVRDFHSVAVLVARVLGIPLSPLRGGWRDSVVERP